MVFLPRVEALRTSTLGYEIATPTELPGVRANHYRSPIPTFPKVKERYITDSNTTRRSYYHLGMAGKGSSDGL